MEWLNECSQGRVRVRTSDFGQWMTVMSDWYRERLGYEGSDRKTRRRGGKGAIQGALYMWNSTRIIIIATIATIAIIARRAASWFLVSRGPVICIQPTV